MWYLDDNVSNADDIKDYHHDNRLLYNFMSLSTSGAAPSFLLKCKPKPGILPNGKAAWDGLIAKYQKKFKAETYDNEQKSHLYGNIGWARPRRAY